MDIRQTAIASLLLFAGCQALNPNQSNPTAQPNIGYAPQQEQQRSGRPPQPPAPLPQDFQQPNNTKWRWPTLDGQPRPITSGFGYRNNPVFPEQGQQFHSGIDLQMPYGEGITAARDGMVIASGAFEGGKSKGCGYGVVIEHSDGLTSTYCHMSEVWAQQGIQVKQGETIGLVGSTGYSTGPHLHFSVKLPASSEQWVGDAIDPLEVLP